MLKNKESKSNKEKDNKILRKSKISSQQSVKKKTPSWPPDNLWQNKKKKSVKKRRWRLKWKNKDFRKLKRSLCWSIRRNKRWNSKRRRKKRKNWQSSKKKQSKGGCFWLKDKLLNKLMLSKICRKEKNVRFWGDRTQNWLINISTNQ